MQKEISPLRGGVKEVRRGARGEAIKSSFSLKRPHFPCSEIPEEDERGCDDIGDDRSDAHKVYEEVEEELRPSESDQRDHEDRDDFLLEVAAALEDPQDGGHVVPSETEAVGDQLGDEVMDAEFHTQDIDGEVHDRR